MRRFVTLFMTLLFVMLPVLAHADSGQIQLVVNGTPVVTDVPPVVENDRTLVPIRALSETLGFEVDWDDANRAVTLAKGEQVIVLYIGRADTLVNGQPKPIDVPPVIRENRTLIPVRFVAENLGLEVSWDPSSRIVGITRPAVETPPATSVDPAVQALWDTVAQQRDGHILGTLVTETMGTVSETQIEAYMKGQDVLVYTTMDLPSAGEMKIGMALYQGKYWQQMPGAGWSPIQVPEAADLTASLTAITDGKLNLALAKVQLSQEQLNGVPMSKLTMEWDNADLAKASGGEAGDLGEGTTVMTFWVGQDGLLKQMDQLMTMKVNGIDMVTRGTYIWSPLEGEIPFPAEILQ